MLEIKYEKDLEKQYAVLEGEEITEYGIKMLQDNQMKGLLAVQIKTIDNQNWYYYDITKQTSLKQLLKKKQVSLDRANNILIQIFQATKEAGKFLMDEQHLVLDTEMIYLYANHSDVVQIGYYPPYQKDIMEQLIELMEVFLDCIDYQKEERSKVERFYSIYDKAREEGMTCRELMRVVMGEEEKVRTEKTADSIFSSASSESEKEQTGVISAYHDAAAMQQDNAQKEHKRRINIFEKERPRRDSSHEYQKRDWQHLKQKAGSVLQFMFLAVISVIILGTGITTNIFRSTVTGALDYKKFAVLCMVMAVMDILAWKYFKKGEETVVMGEEKKEFVWGELTPKQEENEFTSVMEELEKTDMGAEASSDRGSADVDLKTTEDSKKAYNFYEAQSAEILSEDFTVLLDQEETMLLCEDFMKTQQKTWKLISLTDKLKLEIPLKKFPFYLGKLQWNVDYALDFPSISRVHGRFDREGERLFLTDLDSTNGTYLNHIKLENNSREEIKDGDEISFADLKFRLERV